MNTPAAALASRILAALAGHSAQKPARADDVIAIVGGPEGDTWAALEQLVLTCQINTAHIQRKGEPQPWLAIWPTGVIREIGGWRGNDHQMLLTPHPTQREIVKAANVPKVRTPRRVPAPVPAPVSPSVPTPTRRRAHPPSIEAVRRLVAGRAEDSAISLSGLARALGGKGDAAYGDRIRSAVMTTDWMAPTRKAEAGDQVIAYYDRRAEASGSTRSGPLHGPAAPAFGSVLAASGLTPAPTKRPAPKPVKARPDERPEAHGVDVRLLDDGTLQVRFAPSYKADICHIYVQDVRRDLLEGQA